MTWKIPTPDEKETELRTLVRDLFPYLNWETALDNLPRAIDKAIDNEIRKDMVEALQGQYGKRVMTLKIMRELGQTTL